jgi:hypothetical protein
MHQALDDLHHRLLGQLGVLEQRALAFAEAMPTTAAVQPTDAFVPAHPLADAQIARPKPIEVRAILVGSRYGGGFNYPGFGNFFGQIGEIRISNIRRYGKRQRTSELRLRMPPRLASVIMRFGFRRLIQNRNAS